MKSDFWARAFSQDCCSSGIYCFQRRHWELFHTRGRKPTPQTVGIDHGSDTQRRPELGTAPHTSQLAIQEEVCISRHIYRINSGSRFPELVCVRQGGGRAGSAVWALHSKCDKVRKLLKASELDSLSLFLSLSLSLSLSVCMCIYIHTC